MSLSKVMESALQGILSVTALSQMEYFGDVDNLTDRLIKLHGVKGYLHTLPSC